MLEFCNVLQLEGMYQIAAGQGIYFFWSQSEPLGTRRRKDSSDFIRFQGVFGGASARSQTAFPMVQTLGSTNAPGCAKQMLQILLQKTLVNVKEC
jgi:hypothetical protein